MCQRDVGISDLYGRPKYTPAQLVKMEEPFWSGSLETLLTSQNESNLNYMISVGIGIINMMLTRLTLEDGWVCTIVWEVLYATGYLQKEVR